MKPMVVIAFLVAAGVCAPALASPRLAQQKQCMQCHAIDRHVVGPSFQDIRAVYARMESPERKMVDVIRMGSSANLGPHWGQARMPDGSERPLVSKREARQLARWILSLP